MMDARFLDHPRDRIVDAAVTGMRNTGLAGAGINQVIATSGAPKGSLYHYFPGGKLQLAAEALERFGELRRQDMSTVMAAEGPVDQNVKRLFKRAAKGMEAEGFRLGCAIGGVVLDLDEDCAELEPVCGAVLESWAEVIGAAFERVAPARRRILARFVVTALQGALVQARASRSSQPLLEAGEFAASLVRAELQST
jgi:TetR/AcrR family transcriptional regulator, lmrAB and yxaGH operons repressor